MKEEKNTINPQILKAARKQQRMTQQQLADKIGCTKDTISRWERGKSKRVRSHLQDPLCDVLRIKWEKLIEPTKQEKVVHRDYTTKVSISREVRISLQLVAERYNVRPREVLDLAPLLFLIVAEQSLLERKRRLEMIYKVMEEARENLLENCAHLGGIITARSDFADQQLEEEKLSLKKRDVFGWSINYDYWHEDHQWDEDNVGPFLHFLRSLTDKLPKDAVTYIKHGRGGHNTIGSYRIADDTLRECTGISEDEEMGETLLNFIRLGWINFTDCLRVRRDKNEENYRSWLFNELSQIGDTLKEINELPEGEKILRYIDLNWVDFRECLRVKRNENKENYGKWLSTELAKIEAAEERRIRELLEEFSPTA